MKKLFYIMSIMILLTTFVFGENGNNPNANKPNRYDFDIWALLSEVIDDSTDSFRFYLVDSTGAQTPLETTTANYDTTYNANRVIIVGDSTAYDSALDAIRVAIINGQVFHYTPGASINATNTAVADSLSIVFSMASYHWLSLDSYLGATTQNIILKMFRTNDATASATDPYDGKWIPCSVKFLGASDETGVTVANTTLNANYENEAPTTAEFYMVRITFTGAVNTYKFVDKRSY